MRSIFIIALVSCFVLAACGSDSTTEPTQNPGSVHQDDYGDAWPFTVESGVIRCLTGERVVFESGGVTYAINGLARGAMEQQGWSDVGEIWRDNPEGPAPKVSLDGMISLGLGLCP